MTDSVPEVPPVPRFTPVSFDPAHMVTGQDGKPVLGLMLSNGGGEKLILEMPPEFAVVLGGELSQKGMDGDKLNNLASTFEGIQDKFRDR